MTARLAGQLAAWPAMAHMVLIGCAGRRAVPRAVPSLWLNGFAKASGFPIEASEINRKAETTSQMP
jgi:hypothetical protein